MRASSVWVDRPVERHSLDTVQDGLHLDLDPFDLRRRANAGRAEEPWGLTGNLELRRLRNQGKSGSHPASTLIPNTRSCQRHSGG